MKKSPIQIERLDDSLSQTDTEQQSLAEACLNCVGIEQYENERSFTAQMPTPYQQRLRSGNSLLMVVTTVQTDTETGTTTVKGRINYEPLPYAHPETVLASLRHKSQSDSSTGEMVYGVKVDFDGGNSSVSFDFGERSGSHPSLHSVKSCPRFTITDLETTGVTGTVTLEEIAGGYSGQSEYIHSVGWEGEAEEYLAAGDYVLLEESPDAYVAESIHQVLQHPQYNGTHRLLTSLLNGDTDNRTDAFNSAPVSHFLDWMDTQPDVNAPNSEQRGFIGDIEHELCMLQGPPGTGKTSTTIAPSILARLRGYDGDGPCRTLVSGASNVAIDEVMTDVAELIDTYQQSPHTSDQLDDTLLLRMTDKPDQETLSPAVANQVTFATPWMDEWPEQSLKARLEKPVSGESPQNVIIFATPRRVWHIGKDLHDNYIFQSHVESESAGVKSDPSQTDRLPYEYFDLMVIDEASMMNVPQLLLSGMFYDPGGSILIAGDHRQLPPVQQHDWQSELAPSIRALAPHLSVLNFGRLLGGEDIHSIDDRHKTLLEIGSLPGLTIPLHQLQQTYRCHTDVAEFLETWVYKNLDDISFRSERSTTLSHTISGTNGVTAAADLDAPFVLITYENTSFQQMNPVESTITREILNAVEVPTHNTPPPGDDTQFHSDLFGVVTPHNAHRGHLESTLNNIDGTDYTTMTDIDTVERFQGGERKMMIVNATVSDPDYIASESEFLLNLNRLNVAMSRMKQKLVVVASDSIFDHIPSDTTEYDNTVLWKGLAQDSGINTPTHTPQWEGTLEEFTGLPHNHLSEEIDTETHLSVHHITHN